MSMTAAKTVSELALENTTATRVFEDEMASRRRDQRQTLSTEKDN
jgi:hypothetical protein